MDQSWGGGGMEPVKYDHCGSLLAFCVGERGGSRPCSLLLLSPSVTLLLVLRMNAPAAVSGGGRGGGGYFKSRLTGCCPLD